MALRVYDADVDHVGLGPRGGTRYGFTIAGGYTRSLQREGSRAVELGGQTDLVGPAPSMSRWSQDAFEGGAFEYRITDDKARFADCRGFIPQLQGRGAISIPPMWRNHPFDPLNPLYTSLIQPEVGVPTYVQPKAMFPVAGSIYIVFKHGVFRWRSDTDALSFNGTYGTWLNIVDGDYDPNDQKLYLLCSPPQEGSSGGGLPFLARLNTDLTVPTVQATYTAPAGLANKLAYGMRLDGPSGLIVLSLGLRLYTVDPPSNTDDATKDPKWVEVGRLPGRWRDSISFAGRTYILCNEADGTTHLVAFDGTQLLPVAELPFNFEGRALCSYGGRIFVVGAGTDVNGGDRYGEIYEVTGASVRQVRTFRPEHYAEYANETPKIFHSATVTDGLLWTSWQSRGLVAYDLSADAFWGASDFQGVTTNLEMFALCRGRGSLYGYGQHNGLNQNQGLWRVATPEDEEDIGAYECQLETSDFDYEIARSKRWSEIVLQTKIAPNTTIAYSLDSGQTWTNLTSTVTADGDLETHRASLAAVDASPRIRFRFTVDRDVDVSYRVSEIVAFTVSFFFLDSGKWAWGMNVIGADAIEARNGTSVTQDVPAIAAALSAWAADKTSLTFTDLDGETHDVTIIDYRETQPVIGPNVTGGRPEAFFQIALQEA